MARIRWTDTKPELTVRRLLHRMGYRFRLHVAKLPGWPDIVLPKHSVAVPVNEESMLLDVIETGALPQRYCLRSNGAKEMLNYLQSGC